MQADADKIRAELSRCPYARYGIGTTDEQEALPRRARKERTCSGCHAPVKRGQVFVEHVQEAYCTGDAYCLSCLRQEPTRIPGVQIVFGVPDLGKLINGRSYV